MYQASQRTSLMVIAHAPGPLCYFQSICGIRAFFLHYYFNVDARSTFSTHHSVPLLLTMIIGATVSPVLAHRLSRCRTFQSNNSCDALCAVRVSFVFTEECSCCCYSSGFFLRFTAAHLRNASTSPLPPLRYSLASSWGRALKKLGEKCVPLRLRCTLLKNNKELMTMECTRWASSRSILALYRSRIEDSFFGLFSQDLLHQVTFFAGYTFFIHADFQNCPKIHYLRFQQLKST